MALTRAQLLQGNNANGIVLPGTPQGVTAGAGVTIASNGQLSVDASSVIGLVKLNNPGAFNAYVWPGVDGTSGQFLQTDGTGNLSWASPSGFAVVTVSTITPSPADVGELWYDCNTGTLKVFQNCVSPNGWTSVSQPGLPVLPANTTAAPPFTGGNGTQATPYDCTVTTASSGSSVFVVNTVTIGGLAPFQFVPIVDLNAITNGGRFTFSNNYADGSGNLVFQTIFKDQPASPPSTSYTAAIKVGYGTVYIDAIVNVVTPLSVTSGSISGTPQIGATLTYTQGVASGGTGPYTLTQQWYRDGVAISGATGLTYTLVTADLGANITVEITATDVSLATATATTAPVGPVVTAPFPSGVWNPTPAGGLNTIPGGISATYNGAGPTVSSTGCIEISVNGGAYSQGPTPISSGQTLAARWIASSACGDAATGANLTGDISDGTYENSYAVTVNRKPTPAIANISDTNVGLGAVTSKATAAIAGLTATAYVTLGTGSTGTNIRISTDGVTWVNAPAAPSIAFPINNGDQLYIEQTVGGSTSVGYTAIVAIGDSTGVGGAASTFQTVTYTATTTSSAVFPGVTFANSGPNAAPDTVSAVAGGGTLGTLNGTSSSNAWPAGVAPVTLSSPGGTPTMKMKVGANPFATSGVAVASGNVLDIAWNEAYIATVTDGNTATGTFTGTVGATTYTNTFTMVVKRSASWTAPQSTATTAGLNTAVNTGVLTVNNFNVPVTVSFANPTTAGAVAMTAVSASVNGGAATAITLGTTTITLNPGDNLQVFGTTGGTNSTKYGVNITIGTSAAQDWFVTTTAAVPSIDTPSITSPANGSTNLNPALNTPASIPLVGSAYSPQNGAGAQTSSTWEVYKWVGGGSPVPPTTLPDPNYTAVTGSPFTVSSGTLTTVNVPQASLAVSSTYYARVQYATTNTSAATSSFSNWSSFATASSFVPSPGTAFGGGYFAGQINDGGIIYNLIVAPVTSGSLQGQYGGATPTVIQYKTSASADTPSATVQNQVYGGLTTDLLKSSGVHPVFSTFINGGSGPNAGAFNLATGGAGGGTGIGGYNDWYLPARNELAVLYFFLKPDTTANNTSSGSNPNSVAPYTPNTAYGPGFPNQTTSTLFQAGGAQAFSTANLYWSSSEYSSVTFNAWLQNFFNGNQNHPFNAKNTSNYARAVRRVAA